MIPMILCAPNTMSTDPMLCGVHMHAIVKGRRWQFYYKLKVRIPRSLILEGGGLSQSSFPPSASKAERQPGRGGMHLPRIAPHRQEPTSLVVSLSRYYASSSKPLPSSFESRVETGDNRNLDEKSDSSGTVGGGGVYNKNPSLPSR